jgi:hypothetical protein
MAFRQLGDEDGTGAFNGGRAIQPGWRPGAAPQVHPLSFDSQSSVPPLGLGPGLGKHRRMSTTSSPEDGPSEPPGAATNTGAAPQELLACVSCRSRKLKCEILPGCSGPVGGH